MAGNPNTDSELGSSTKTAPSLSIHEPATQRSGVKGFFQNLIGYNEHVLAAASTSDTLLSSVRAEGGFGQGARTYVRRLFPFVNWIPHYNLTWAMGDVIAGLTVGMVVVPQSMSYAK